MLGDGAAGGNLDSARLFLGGVIRRVALRAHGSRVGRKDEPILAAVNKCFFSRVGERDVCETAQEHDPSVLSGEGGENKGSAGRDILLGWCVVETRIEPGRNDRVARVGEAAELQAARADGARLRRGGEAGKELPALEYAYAALRCERSDVEEGWGREA
jgi:hypothetical protein